MKNVEILAKHYDYDLFYLKKHAIEIMLAMAPVETMKAFELTAGRLDRYFDREFFEALDAKKDKTYSIPTNETPAFKGIDPIKQALFWSCYTHFISFAWSAGYECSKQNVHLYKVI